MLASLWRGVGAAVRAPLWMRGARLRRLMEPAAPGPPAAHDAAALLASRRALRLLSRLPRSPWRDTCLYRSVAECLVLRGLRVDARLRIGVRGEGPGQVGAHAWVSVPGRPAAEDARGHAPFDLR